MEKKQVPLIPAIDRAECTDCGSCLEVCPDVFIRNDQTQFIEVRDLESYPEECVQEAMKVCPADCIRWEDDSLAL
jgi:ferredoxin